MNSSNVHKTNNVCVHVLMFELSLIWLFYFNPMLLALALEDVQGIIQNVVINLNTFVHISRNLELVLLFLKQFMSKAQLLLDHKL